MAFTKLQIAQARASDREHETRLLLRKLDRENWWQAFLALVLLLGAIVVFSLPEFLTRVDSSFAFQAALYLRALLGLVLIFAIYTLSQQHLLKLLRNQMVAQLETVTEQRMRADSLYELAVLDPLTGLYNRRFVEERLRAEIARADRSGDPLVVLLLDMDDFKRINDRCGHAAGDMVLKELAHRIRKAVRASDFAVRMGGDEFLVLLPECPPEKVNLILSRLAPFEMNLGGEKISVSSSTGFAQYQPGETVDQLIGRADQALYASKAVHPDSLGVHEPRQITSDESAVSSN